MITENCPHKGCKFTASYPKLITVRAVIGKHRKKEHGYVSPGQTYYKTYMAKKKGVRSRPRNSEDEPVETPKLKRMAQELHVTLCPVCGCDIEAVKVAINLRRGK